MLELVSRLRRIRKEVRDLKTAHDRGLGVVELYEATAVASLTAVSTACVVTVVFEDGGIMPGFCQLGLSLVGGNDDTTHLGAVAYKDGGKTIVYTYYLAGANGAYVRARAVGFSRIASVEVEVS